DTNILNQTGCVHCLFTTSVILCDISLSFLFFFFFFNDTATTEIYTLSLHDALPIFSLQPIISKWWCSGAMRNSRRPPVSLKYTRSEEHTSELQSPCNLVCRLLLEKKKKNRNTIYNTTRAPLIFK